MTGVDRLRGHGPRDARGFTLVEIMAATVILMVIVISLSNLLIDSLTATVLSRQREAAASIASDTVENAKAIGQTGLAASALLGQTCPVTTGTVLPTTTPVPALTVLTPYKTALDNTTYTVCSAVTASTSTVDTVSVTVTWSSGNRTYLTSTQVGR